MALRTNSTDSYNQVSAFNSVTLNEDGSLSYMVSVPEKHGTVETATWRDIIRHHENLIIEALKKRIDHCFKGLQAAIEIVSQHNGRVVYKDQNGMINKFNLPSYKKMMEVVPILEYDDLDLLEDDTLAWDQILKAVSIYVDEECKLSLVSVCAEMLMFANRKNCAMFK